MATDIKRILNTNYPYIINIFVFLAYFVFKEDRSAWPEQFFLLAWLPFLVHFYLHHFFDSLQHTTRCIGGIYLTNKHGLYYEKHLLSLIHTALIPNKMLPAFVLWVTFHIVSFTLILFFQGWATALIAEFTVLVSGIFLPLKYQGHLRRVRDYALDPNVRTSTLFYVFNISSSDLAEIADQALREKRNPFQWWKEISHKVFFEEKRLNISSMLENGISGGFLKIRGNVYNLFSSYLSIHRKIFSRSLISAIRRIIPLPGIFEIMPFSSYGERLEQIISDLKDEDQEAMKINEEMQYEINSSEFFQVLHSFITALIDSNIRLKYICDRLAEKANGIGFEWSEYEKALYDYKVSCTKREECGKMLDKLYSHFNQTSM